jgi:hypothetical protein
VRDVRPILSQHCFACHGPNEDSRKAGLSLVDFNGATRELDPGLAAIVPGDLDRSELWQRINNPEDPMPPPEEHKALSPEQIEILGSWIQSGASYAPHWAYVSPVATDPPISTRSNWALTESDRHLLARLDAEGLTPSPDTDQVTLLRRVTYDLSGLPPTIDDIDSFLADTSPGAYDRVVDRLLSSPHFGERMASFWLDLVRYADTVGYHGDQEHHAWPYRDWVIRSFNENLPFDAFTIHQLAGDLVENPGQDELVASGYNRLLQTTHEGGLQLKEYRAIYMADRVRNVSEAWMGATLGCAQCHDHKYDPYTMRDFYAFGAFFADIDDEDHLVNPYGGLNATPTKRLPEMRVQSDASRARATTLTREIEKTNGELTESITALEPHRAAWEADLLRRIVAGETRQQTWVDDVLETGGDPSGNWAFGHVPELTPKSGSSYRTQISDGLVQHYTNNTTKKRITVEEGDVLFAWVYLPQQTPPQAVMLQCNTAGDWDHRAVWGNDAITYGRRAEDWNGYRRKGPLPETGTWVRLEASFDQIGLPPGTVVSGIAFTQFGGTVHWDRVGVESSRAAPLEVVAALETPQAQRTEAMMATLRARHASESPEVTEIEAHRESLEAERSGITDTLPLALYTQALETPRSVRILPRGNWLDESGELVEPSIPEFLGTLDGDGRLTRLDLAEWLVAPQAEGGVGEFTARVFVNRIWAMLFGTGLCPSVEDFGGQGRPPTHPALLDRLALSFVNSGWDVKALVKDLVLSHAYRQSSMIDDVLLERDPENLLVARQSRHRLPAEMVRDTALSVSGILVDKRGGPSVKPPQPPGYYRHLNFPKRRYMPDTDAQQWRRGVYVHWQRQYLHPMLRAFDGPTREECTARRANSNTPLAALVLMNDPTYVEAARAFAQRVLARDFASDQEALVFAMRLATARNPSEEEVRVLAALLSESRAAYHGHEPEALALLELGALPRNESIDPVELAAWTQTTRAILNLHETITRD